MAPEDTTSTDKKEKPAVMGEIGKNTYMDFRIKMAVEWSNITRGSASTEEGRNIARAMKMVEGIDDETWAVVYAESTSEMKNPIDRREILRGIALEPENTAELLNMLRNEYVKSGEIILPGKRDSRMRIKSINSSGSIDIVIATTGEVIKSIPVNRKGISYGFYTYRAQGTQKRKRGEPEGILRLYFQHFRKGMSRVARGYYPNTSVLAMSKTLNRLYIPGVGLTIGKFVITDDVLMKEFQKKDGFESAKELFKNAELIKAIAEACTRENGTYRSPIESLYKIET